MFPESVSNCWLFFPERNLRGFFHTGVALTGNSAPFFLPFAYWLHLHLKIWKGGYGFNDAHYGVILLILYLPSLSRLLLFWLTTSGAPGIVINVVLGCISDGPGVIFSMEPAAEPIQVVTGRKPEQNELEKNFLVFNIETTWITLTGAMIQVPGVEGPGDGHSTKLTTYIQFHGKSMCFRVKMLSLIDTFDVSLLFLYLMGLASLAYFGTTPWLSF